MTQFAFHFLGHFQVSADAIPVTNFHSDKARALLAYLALELQEHSRAELAALLWPEINDRYARTNLRNTLHRLRQTLDIAAPGAADQLLAVTRQAVQVNTEVAFIDVNRFQTLVDDITAAPLPNLDQMEEAILLYQGELLAGFDIADAQPFEDWLLIRREMLHQRSLLLFHTLATVHEKAGNISRAYTVACRLLTLDPYREESYRQIMRLLTRMGLPEQAMQQFKHLEKLLRAEMNVDPAADTLVLAAEIATGEFDRIRHTEHLGNDYERNTVATASLNSLSNMQMRPSIPTPSVIDLCDVPDPGPFFGREKERQQLCQWLLHDHAHVVAILGIGGMGKTALAAQCIREIVTDEESSHFDAIYWRTLINAPPLAKLLPPLLQSLANQQPIAISESVDEQIRLLLAYLRDRHILLILDHMESILEPNDAGTFRSGYESYGQLIQQITTLAHRGQLLLTSQERPRGYARLERDGYPIYSLQLSGLDMEAGFALMTQRRIANGGHEIAALIERYSGNPLALKLVADTVNTLFNGDLSAFLVDNSLIFDDIRTMLDQHFARLNRLELQILLKLAVGGKPISTQYLCNSLIPLPKQRDFLEALRSLQRRSLLQNQGTALTLHNLVSEYLTDQYTEFVVSEVK